MPKLRLLKQRIISFSVHSPARAPGTAPTALLARRPYSKLKGFRHEVFRGLGSGVLGVWGLGPGLAFGVLFGGGGGAFGP